MTTSTRIPNFWTTSTWILSALLILQCSEAQDTTKCFESLTAADVNGDLKLDRIEYVKFLELYEVPNIREGSLYQNLPLVLQSTFFSISCICTSNGAETQPCCFGADPYIPIEAAAETVPTQAQVSYLGRLCGLTDSAVVQIIPTFPPVVTAVPSMSPSTAPSEMTTEEAPVATKIQTQYTIGIKNGVAQQIDPFWFTQDLVRAMDVVATEVGIMVEGTNSTRRRLTVTVGLPTSIVGFEEREWSNDASAACPATFANPEADSCQQVTASVDLFVDENSTELTSLFGTTLEEEIEAGRLEEALLLIDPQTPVMVLAGKVQRSGPSEEEQPVDTSSTGLSTGALIGIGAVGAALLAVCIISISKAKKRDEPSSPRRKDDGKFVEATPSEEMKMAEKEVGSGLEWQAPRAAPGEDEEQPNMAENPWVNKKKKDDGSVVSDGGWSDAYSTSVGTNESGDEMSPKKHSPKKTNIEGTENVTDTGSTNLEELEAAIQSENWAAVGASAALLAASQYESDSQTDSRASRGVDSSVQSSINRRELDTEKTRELDNLIQSGDWEGVIQAAARFEAEMGQGDQSATVFEDSDSRSDSKSSRGSFTIGSQFSSVQQSSAASADAGSKAPPTESQQEFKREVQELVNKVVPEEADHVDDMIEQFKGRENELLETLRTMQERSVAQKARTAEQQRAKIEAKQMVTQARKEQTHADPGEQVLAAPAPAMAPMPASMPVSGAPIQAASPMAAPAPVPMAPARDMNEPVMVRNPALDGFAPMTQDPTPFPAPVVTRSPTEAPTNTEDAAAAAAADWAIAQALSNLEKSSFDENSYDVPDEDFHDEGSL